MNKKYLPSALILYLNYFIHGVGCSILGQAVIKEMGTYYYFASDGSYVTIPVKDKVE